MADETIIEPAAEPSEAQKRITQLSDKVRTTAQERDEKDRLLKESTEKYATLEKENLFNSGFADVLGTHPAAKDHKDEIKAKVLAGYTPEDAAFAVLGKAGKLGGTPPAPPINPAGGSAPITPPQGGSKNPSEMSQAEKRAALEGAIGWN